MDKYEYTDSGMDKWEYGDYYKCEDVEPLIKVFKDLLNIAEYEGSQPGINEYCRIMDEAHRILKEIENG